MQHRQGNKNLIKTIAIVGGTGPEGLGLALRFARAGANVRIGSRTLERARTASEHVAKTVTGGHVEGFTNAEAVREASVVVLAVPSDAQVETLESLRDSWRPGTTLVDATVQLKAAGPESSAQRAAQHVPEGVVVAAAFHTLGADLLAQLDHPLDSDVLISSDSAEAKAIATRLVEMLGGARPVDAGPLKNSRLIENIVPLLIAINRRYKVKHSGIRITGI